MKTTFDIPEPLLRDVQTLARERKTTTKSLVEEALRRLLAEATHAEPFRLRDMTYGSGGMSVEYENVNWARLRDEIYEGHGA